MLLTTPTLLIAHPTAMFMQGEQSIRKTHQLRSHLLNLCLQVHEVDIARVVGT